ncbi:MAG: hypothetical protein IJT87_05830 [Ruminiclostridium sp.]|nr:hypothetical protein [Ruminiclostridium sp.]
MRSYYHCVTSRFGKRAVSVITVVSAAAAGSAFIAFIVGYFGLFTSRGGISPVMPVSAAAAITAGLAIALAVRLSADKKTAMHSRYTFLDMQLKFAAVSIYSGEVYRLGKRSVVRELYLIPFESFASASPSRSGKKLIIRGKMRRYAMNSDDLGYHIRDGAAEFDRWWLNFGAFEELDGAEIPALFGDPARICSAFEAGKKRFDALPKPRPHTPGKLAKPVAVPNAQRRRMPERLHYDPYRNRYV